MTLLKLKAVAIWLQQITTINQYIYNRPDLLITKDLLKMITDVI